MLRSLKGAGGRGVAKVRAAWAEVAGPEVAGRTRVAAVEQGRVRVEVASAALKHDLSTFRRPALLKQLQERLPELAIKQIVFRVGTAR